VLHFPAWLVGVAIALTVIAILLSFQARTGFEIGKGAASISRQKRYDRFLRKAIPGFLAAVLAGAAGEFVYATLWSK
jgi:hypothetical protein